MRQRGFTLPELMIVVGVFGLLLAAASPVLRDIFEGYRYENAIHRISGQVFMTRQLAVRNGCPARLQLNPGQSSYLIFCDEDRDGTRGADEMQLGPYVLDAGLTFGSVQLPGNEVVFLPNGTVSAGGSFRIVDGRGRSRLLTINSLTGAVEVSS